MYENNNPLQNYQVATGQESSFNAYVVRVFATMFLGLLATAATSFLVLSTDLIFTLGNALYVILIAEVLLVVWMSSRVQKFQYTSLLTLFYVYSILNGITLSTVFYVYDIGFIGKAFATTSITFGVMAIYGATTKNDLTRFGSFAIMGLVGGIVLFMVNWFLRSSSLDYFLSIIMLVIFIGLVAYDTQKLKAYYYSTAGNVEMQKKSAVMGALSLYLDFINIFLYILRIFGRNRK